jgi:hypothetical protein
MIRDVDVQCIFGYYSLIIIVITAIVVGRVSSVGIATGYGLYGPWIESR